MSGGMGGNAGNAIGGAGASVMPDGTAGTAGMGVAVFNMTGADLSGGGGGSAGGTGGNSKTVGGGGVGGLGGNDGDDAGGSGGSGGLNGAMMSGSGLVNFTDYNGGRGSDGTAGQVYFDGYSAGGGGGGEGGFGLILTAASGFTSFTNEANLQGGNGGLGGAGAGGGAAGLSGDGGVGLDVVASGITVTNSGSISGGYAPYVGGVGYVGNDGIGLLAGSNLTLIDTGYLGGGSGGAAAVSFTGGANTIALGSNGYLFGAIAVATDASLTFNQTAGSFTNNLTLGNLIEGGGSIIKNDATVLDLTNVNTYTGGTTISAGTLALLRETSAGTGTIAFGSTAGETLRLDFAGTTAAPNTLVAPISGFVVGDKLDLTGINSNATVSYTGGVLTVSDGRYSDQITINQAPAGSSYVVSNDGSDHALVTLATTSPTIAGTHATADTSEAPVTPFSGVTVADPNGGADTLTITLSGGGGLLSEGANYSGPRTLTPAGASNSYTLSGTDAQITAELDALSFTPSAGAANSSTPTTFTLTDASSAGSPSTPDSGTVVTDTDPAVPPTITNGSAPQTTTSEMPVTPFGGATVSDTNAAAGSSTAGTATDTLTITLSGGNGGTLSEGANYAGPRTLTPAGGSNSYTLSGTGAAITAELDQLSFTPNAGAAGTSSTTTFTLSDTSTAGGASNIDATSRATDTDPAAPAPAPAPAPTPTPTPAPVPAPTPDTTPPSVSFDSTVSFSSPTVATLTGRVSDNVGVASVQVFEGNTNLGAATVKADGTWSFTHSFPSGGHGDLSALATDAAGNTASTAATFDLQTGLHGIPGQPYRAVQDRYDTSGNALGSTFFERDGTVLFSSSVQALPNGGSSVTYSNGAFFADKPYSSFSDIYRPDGELAAVHELDNTSGSHTLLAENSDVTLHSQYQDTMIGIGTSDRFVFTTGYGHDTVENFNLSGPNHDTLSLPSSDFASLGQLLRSTRDTAAGVTIRDPSSGDRITVAGISKAELIAHPKDVAFHA